MQLLMKTGTLLDRKVVHFHQSEIIVPILGDVDTRFTY